MNETDNDGRRPPAVGLNAARPPPPARRRRAVSERIPGNGKSGDVESNSTPDDAPPPDLVCDRCGHNVPSSNAALHLAVCGRSRGGVGGGRGGDNDDWVVVGGGGSTAAADESSVPRSGRTAGGRAAGGLRRRRRRTPRRITPSSSAGAVPKWDPFTESLQWVPAQEGENGGERNGGGEDEGEGSENGEGEPSSSPRAGVVASSSAAVAGAATAAAGRDSYSGARRRPQWFPTSFALRRVRGQRLGGTERGRPGDQAGSGEEGTSSSTEASSRRPLRWFVERRRSREERVAASHAEEGSSAELPSRSERDEGSTEWPCPLCTLLNQPNASRCEACHSRRPPDPNRPRAPDSTRTERLINDDNYDDDPYGYGAVQEPLHFASNEEANAARTHVGRAAVIGSVLGGAFAGLPGAVYGGYTGALVGTAQVNQRIRDRARASASASASASPASASAGGSVSPAARERADGRPWAFVPPSGYVLGHGDGAVLLTPHGVVYPGWYVRPGADGARNRRWRGADEATIASLPTTTVQSAAVTTNAASSSGKDDNGSSGCQPDREVDGCAICLEEFCGGDRRTTLPCLHGFHEACVDRWLRCNATCPVCKHAI